MNREEKKEKAAEICDQILQQVGKNLLEKIAKGEIKIVYGPGFHIYPP